MKTGLTAKVALVAFSLAAVVGCEEAPAEIEGPYVPPQVKGYDGRRLIWKPRPEELKQCYEPDFSPDGTKVVASYRNGEFGRDADVAILDLTTAEFKVVLEGNSAKRPQWSPTGEWIAYQSDLEPAPYIWLCRPDGSENQKLELEINEVYVPYWGPKGDKIYFVGHYVRREPLYALWYDLRTKELAVLRKPVNELHHNVAVPSPGGDNVALGLMERYGRHGHVVLALVDVDGSRFRVLWSEINENRAGIGNPRDWSPDGKYVLLRYSPLHGTGDSLWTYELKTRAVRQLTMCPLKLNYESHSGTSWGPNGDIVFGTEDGWLYLIKAPE